MRTRNSLERLAAVAPSEPLLEAGEEDRILGRILTAERSAVRRRRPLAVVLVAAVVVGAAAVAAVLTHNHATRSARTHGQHQIALTGPRVQLAGYHFRTPAGFSASKENCVPPPVAGHPEPAIDGFAAAAAGGGACIEAPYLVAGDWLQSHDPIPDSAVAVDVGQHHGYYVAPQGSSDESSLYVNLPGADGERVVYLWLSARDVPEDELIAIAASGLPTLPPPGPVTTTG